MNSKLQTSNPTTTNRDRALRLLNVVTEDLRDTRNTGSVRQSLLQTQSKVRDMLAGANSQGSGGAVRGVTSAHNREIVRAVTSGSGLEVRCSA